METGRDRCRRRLEVEGGAEGQEAAEADVADGVPGSVELMNPRLTLL